MDSDSSLDGEFETKHEIAAQARRDDEVAVAVSSKSERGVDSGDESVESVGDKDSSLVRSPPIDRDSSPIRSPLCTDRDCSPIHSPPPTDRGEMSPKSNNDFSGSESDSISSTSSIASIGRPISPVNIETPGQDDREISIADKGSEDGPRSPEESRQRCLEENGPRSPEESGPRSPDETGPRSPQESGPRSPEENGPRSPEECDGPRSVEENEKISEDKSLKKDDIPGHGEDLSDVSDLDSNDGRDSLDVVSEEESRKKSASKGEWKGTVSTAPVEEMEQLDFEAEEQVDKDEKEEGECDGGGDKSEDDGELKEGDDLEEGELTDEDENRPEETEPRPVCRFYNRGQCTWGSSCRFVHPGVTDKGNYTMFDMVRPLVPVNGPPVYPSVEYRAPYEKPVVGLSYQGSRKEEMPVFESAWERGLRQAKEMMRKSTKRKETDMDFEEKKMNLSLGQEELDKENDYYTRPASPIKDETDRMKLLEAEGKYDDNLLADRYDEFSESPSAYYHTSARSGGDYWRRVHYEPGDTRAMRIETDYGGSSRKYHSSHQHRTQPSEYYEKKKKSSHPVREVIMQRTEKPWRDESSVKSRYTEVSVPSHRGRGDEWADPWMRSKSPSGRKTGSSSRPSRRQSYSSGSSYSTSSSSHSSSQSSYSSYSHDSHSRSRSKSLSRSRSRSSSRTPLSRSRRKINRPLVPTARAAEALSPSFQAISTRKVLKQQSDPRSFSKASLIQSEKKAASERALLMNPPAPSPRKQKEVRPPSPGMMRKSAQNPPPPPPPNSRAKLNLERSKAAVVAAALSGKVKLRSQSKSSRSSSGSDSSGSSSDSSESSYSSSSSSREPSPKVVRPPKRIVIDERERLALAQSLKVKAMDALKLSGQKQQIKLTLKTPGSVGAPGTKRPVTGLPELPELNLVRRERLAPPVVAGKKRPAEEPLSLETSLANKVAMMSKPAAKKATSRREELLKQLKAVEDAIARKRSKI